MDLRTISNAARNLEWRRGLVTAAERELHRQVVLFCSSYHGSMRDVSARMGISQQYLSDVRHGRRKFSDRLVEKLGKLK